MRTFRLRLLAPVIAATLLAAVGHAAFASSPAQQLEPSDLDSVVEAQPRLNFATGSTDRPTEVSYCSVSGAFYDYTTYIYAWDFSESPTVSQLLGYSSHSWDFEPIIVRTSRSTGAVDYAFDSGHYRAGVTERNEFYVSPSHHRFIETSGAVTETQPVEKFVPVTSASLDEMNVLLEKLPRLPFGRGLSLGWACNDPGQVFASGYFSRDGAPRTKLPFQLTLLIGVAVMLIATPAFVIAPLLLRSFGAGTKPLNRFDAAVMLGLASLALLISAPLFDTVYEALFIGLMLPAILFFASRQNSKEQDRETDIGSRSFRTRESMSNPLVLGLAVVVCAVTYLVF
jgi:hypothetical protein